MRNKKIVAIRDTLRIRKIVFIFVFATFRFARSSWIILESSEKAMAEVKSRDQQCCSRRPLRA